MLPRPDGGGYELVQGYRRLGAYRVLYQETEAEDWAEIPALIMPGAPDVAGLYRRMVDENVIRKDLSFAEMARAAQVYAEDPSTSVSTASEPSATSSATTICVAVPSYTKTSTPLMKSLRPITKSSYHHADGL